MPVPQRVDFIIVEQAEKPVADACSTKSEFSCGTGILPVADNGARCEYKMV
ncbi:hypothetical protein [Microcoleus sp. D3_18a_C4]|uniref:hypothetical protein n=1 Tax=unclassified Microcoleus TaxID=2642155 RepID=UPI002FD3FF14